MDSLNIAAWLEGLAHPGGICISGTAYDQVKNKIDLGYEYIGEQTVKNIPDPVRVYRVLIETLKRVLDRNSDFWPAHVLLAASYSEIGREEEARAEAAEIERLSPQISLEARRQRLPYKEQAVLERLFDSLRKAGLK